MPNPALRFFSLLVLAGVLLALTGCPPPRQPSSTTGGGGGGTSTARRTEYRWPLPSDPMTLDPALVTDTVSHAVVARMFNTLVRFDSEGRVQNDLATDYTISEDGLTYTFTIHEGVQFHNGEPCTAADVVYSLRRVLDPETGSYRQQLLSYVAGAEEFKAGKTEEVAGLKAVDDHTVEIKLSQPYAPFINVLCMANLSIVPRSEVERDPEGFADNPVGTGPFLFEAGGWKRDESITLRANRKYFKTPPAIETLVFRILKDEQTRFANFRSGELEHCDLPPSKIKEVQNDPAMRDLIKGEAAMDMYCYGFNCSQPPFKDNTALRKAFNHAINKQHIIENIWGGLVTPQVTYVPQGMFYEWEEAPGYEFNQQLAADLLQQAGYPRGQGLPELVLNIDLQPTNRLVAEAVMEDLRAIGVKVRIEPIDWGPFLQKIYAGEATFHQNTWLADYPDPDNWLYQLLHSENFGGEGNTTRWSNSEFDHLTKQAQTALSEAERIDLYGRAEQIAFDEAPWLLLFWKNSATLVQPYVQNLELGRLDRTPQLGGVAIEDVTFSE